jgi:branched-chain amino acid transport system substrate-binding protein
MKKSKESLFRSLSARWILAGVITVALLCFFAAGPAPAQDKGPIKIGFIAPATGNFAQMGEDMLTGFKMYLEEIGFQVAGRKIELIYEDEGANPGIAVNKARKLIIRDNVHLLAGIFMTSAAYAVGPVAAQNQTPLVITLSAGDDLTQRQRSEWVVRTSFTGSELGYVAADFAYNRLGWRKAVSLAMDYAWGHENVGAFQRKFESLGGKLLQKTWTPVVTGDFGPYVAGLNREADGVFDVVTGAASIRLIKDMEASGLKQKMAIISPGTSTDESLLPALGDSGLGVYSVFNWSAVLDNPQNKAWVAKVRSKLNKEAPMGAALCYDGARWIMAAVTKINGNVEDKKALMTALRGVKLESPLRGDFSMDPYGHPIQDIYVRKVEKSAHSPAGYQNSIVKTYPKSTQFGTYDPEEYLKTPPNTRDYPPLK